MANSPTEVSIREIMSVDEILSLGLREWSQHRSRAGYSHMYVAEVEGTGVAYLTLDYGPLWDYLEIYELYVLPEQRRRGIGSRIISQVELLARKRGCTKVTLRPHPIDQGIDVGVLVRMYSRLGYNWKSEQKDRMVKNING